MKASNYKLKTIKSKSQDKLFDLLSKSNLKNNDKKKIKVSDKTYIGQAAKVKPSTPKKLKQIK